VINEKGRYKEAVIAALLISIAQSISWVVKIIHSFFLLLLNLQINS